MFKALAVIAVFILVLSGVTLAVAKTKGTAHIVSGEIVSIDTTAGTVTVKLDDPKQLNQLKEGEKVTVKHAHAKTTAKTPAPAKSKTMPKSTATPAPEGM